MTGKPQQRSLFDLTVPAGDPRVGRTSKTAPIVRPGQHPAIRAQHKGEEETLDERFARWIEANPQVLEAIAVCPELEPYFELRELQS